ALRPRWWTTSAQSNSPRSCQNGCRPRYGTVRKARDDTFIASPRKAWDDASVAHQAHL
ncbi:unnamed protein product, partial [Musa textilis]